MIDAAGARVNLRVSMITRSALAANIAAATPAHAARLKRPALARPRPPFADAAKIAHAPPAPPDLFQQLS